MKFPQKHVARSVTADEPVITRSPKSREGDEYVTTKVCMTLTSRPPELSEMRYSGW